MSAAQISVPQVVSRKLSAVRGRRRLLTFLAGTSLAAAVFCGLLLAAMLLDWLMTPFESAPRVLLTATVLLGAPAVGLVVIAAWTVISNAFHAVRLAAAEMNASDGALKSWLAE